MTPRRPVTVVTAALLAISVGLASAPLGARGTLLAQDGPNTVTLSMGRSRHETFSQPTEIVRAIGADYLRRVGGPWELGVQLDLDFDRDGGGAEAFLITPVAAYSITPRWPVFAGVGIALEADRTHTYVRLGTEYMFPVGGKGFFLGIGTFIDISDSVTPSVMLAVGRVF